ncbi:MULTISPECIES: branched-chain amino acid ABC transporter permease [Thermomonospora]|uniref:Inner-membrane translocator n=1 Tax=Thermomonospora curvata (strain ATCC 19995 / DSM 43183 / JCM 3096 / KCTC 9072 / NBRC 15933 / NCIMB 10081 / Henssen B9) TaxID=471852 RepID=D1A6Z8_THECD|nr:MULTISPECIES: branched-chain amino acid ABC transporter permease [Thermomonospora]ACY98402.1 inner-membrane translocator [Thermomonospora curvata DSM 43183]PKK13555.1 MAG: branched-chain amino acid ABC transporter permease [Thermomonospora sp. CIF 1]
MSSNGISKSVSNGIGNGKAAVGRLVEWPREWWATAPGYARWTVYLLLIAGALILPMEPIGRVMSPHSDWATVLFYPIGVFILLAIGLNIVVGQAGLLDLGYVAFFAVGGYTMAIFGTKYGWNFWEILIVGVVLSAISGLILGAPTLRLRGDYLAIVTLGFGEIVRITANNSEYVNGPRGIAGIPHPPSLSEVEIFGVQPLKYGVLDPRPYYYLLVALIVLTIIFAKRLEKSRVGRAWAAIREDEDAAELMGVPTFRFKLAAFAIGAAIGGATGVVWASKVISIIPNNFPFILSATILAAVVLGGSGNIPGVMLGAFLVAWLPERFRGLEDYRVLIFGAALVAMMALRPEGILPSRQRKAELAEGTGGMGSMGAEVPTASGAGAADTDQVEVSK